MHQKNITIIITTHERHNLLSTSISYYSKSNCKIIVADSSRKYFTETVSRNINYIHLPGQFFAEKLALALEKVKTPFVIFSADDDFFSIAGLTQGADFLSKNSDYACVQGHYVAFDLTLSSEILWPMYVKSIGFNNFSNDPILRLKNTDMCQKFYGMYRTNQLIKSFSIFRNSDILSIAEVGLKLTSPALGKDIILPIFWMARDIGIYTKYKDVFKIKTDDKDQLKHIYDWQRYLVSKQGQLFIKKLYGLYTDKIGSYHSFEKLIFSVLDDKKIRIKSKTFILTRIIKNLFKKYLPHKITLKLVMKSSIKAQILAGDSKGFPWNDKEAQIEYKKITNHIFKTKNNL